MKPRGGGVVNGRPLTVVFKGVPRCCVEGCKHVIAGKECGRIGHVLPANPDVRERWFRNCRIPSALWKPHFVVCNCHFGCCDLGNPKSSVPSHIHVPTKRLPGSATTSSRSGEDEKPFRPDSAREDSKAESRASVVENGAFPPLEKVKVEPDVPKFDFDLDRYLKDEHFYGQRDPADSDSDSDSDLDDDVEVHHDVKPPAPSDYPDVKEEAAGDDDDDDDGEPVDVKPKLPSLNLRVPPGATATNGGGGGVWRPSTTVLATPAPRRRKGPPPVPVSAAKLGRWAAGTSLSLPPPPPPPPLPPRNIVTSQELEALREENARLEEEIKSLEKAISLSNAQVPKFQSLRVGLTLAPRDDEDNEDEDVKLDVKPEGGFHVANQKKKKKRRRRILGDMPQTRLNWQNVRLTLDDLTDDEALHVLGMPDRATVLAVAAALPDARARLRGTDVDSRNRLTCALHKLRNDVSFSCIGVYMGGTGLRQYRVDRVFSSLRELFYGRLVASRGVPVPVPVSASVPPAELRGMPMCCVVSDCAGNRVMKLGARDEPERSCGHYCWHPGFCTTVGYCEATNDILCYVRRLYGKHGGGGGEGVAAGAGTGPGDLDARLLVERGFRLLDVLPSGTDLGVAPDFVGGDGDADADAMVASDMMAKVKGAVWNMLRNLKKWRVVESEAYVRQAEGRGTRHAEITEICVGLLAFREAGYKFKPRATGTVTASPATESEGEGAGGGGGGDHTFCRRPAN